MNKLSTSLLLVGLALPLVAAQIDLVDELKNTPASAELVVRGKPIPLDDALQKEVIDMLKGVVGGCKTDSKTRPSAFNEFDNNLPFDWERARDPLRRVSYISASLGKLDKLTAGNKSVYSKYIMLETPPGNWPRKYAAIYDGQQSIRFTNCNGFDVVELICTSGIREHMPTEYLSACKTLPGGMNTLDERDKPMEKKTP
jgi:hypothetical protein